MHTVDGSAGGGQLLRTALSLGVVTDTPVRVENVRGERPEPGLKPQHRAAVKVLADYCDADVEGADLGSETVTFDPGDARRETLEIDVGTAGSLTLLFDAVLPVAAVADHPLTVRATGGTDVTWSPPVGYQRHVKLPLLSACGLAATIDVGRTGFYPAGGGRATLRTTPGELSPLELTDRGPLHRVDVYSKAATDLADAEVADRQASEARRRLADAGHPVAVRRVDYVETASPGSALLLRGVYERGLTGVDELGEPGKPSEAVAADAVDAFAATHESGAPVDRHMADQLVVWLALTGGRVRIPAVTAHVETHCDLLAAVGSDVRLEPAGDAGGTLVASGRLGGR
ncbi:RNA 3'-terminal phosphate cyclase [Halobacteriales archaeon Cl-PHB]